MQAYAYEAAVGAAELLDAFGRPGEAWLAWAARLQARFREEFWVDGRRRRFPAVALDGTSAPSTR